MKQKFVYCIDESSNGWLSIAGCEVNEKDKNGFYLCSYSMNLGPDNDGFPDSMVEHSYLFKDEDITWWRTPEAALDAMNLKLHQRYLDKQLPKRYTECDDDYEEHSQEF